DSCELFGQVVLAPAAAQTVVEGPSVGTGTARVQRQDHPASRRERQPVRPARERGADETLRAPVNIEKQRSRMAALGAAHDETVDAAAVRASESRSLHRRQRDLRQEGGVDVRQSALLRSVEVGDVDIARSRRRAYHEGDASDRGTNARNEDMTLP